MSLHPTSRERSTGGATPDQLAADQSIDRLLEDASVIDSAMPGEPGSVTIKRTAGRPIDPHAPLLDRSDPSSYVLAEHAGPGVRVEYRHGGKS